MILNQKEAIVFISGLVPVHFSLELDVSISNITKDITIKGQLSQIQLRESYRCHSLKSYACFPFGKLQTFLCLLPLMLFLIRHQAATTTTNEKAMRHT